MLSAAPRNPDEKLPPVRPPVDDAITADLRDRVASTTFYGELGISVLRASPGEVELAAAPTEAHLNVQGFVHGGVIATLVDTAMGLAVRSALEAGRRHVTIEIGVHYLRPVRPGPLSAIGRTVRVGSSVAFANAEVTDDNGRLLATASGTYSVTATGTDHHKYRTDTYVAWTCPGASPTGSAASPSCPANSSGRPLKKVTVVVRDTGKNAGRTIVRESSTFDAAYG